ncbi:zinc finger CCCH domain-containing protein 46 [Lolium perenne]|uniref:zinc finger CCCH domain-containing protein 46 n=1 Tax=Lolium perenne TaxID=4522 RepID=UPI0021F65156|nr:zinc finger CCCH domain-containing protein 46 [Lolium perenne]
MNRRQELCRNFQRGSCKYGAQCRYLHATSNQQQQQQQQAKPNPFGFGAASRPQQQPFGAQSQQFQQQQQPNRFGFGVQGGGASQPRNAPGPAMPFQNKWVRDPSAATKQPEAQPAAQAAHTSCTDPASCRQQIADDFKNEAPLWKLTCYAHLRSGPCDITGDVSYEELRAKAYEQGKQGHPLQSIVEGERNLQNAKLAEFNTLLSSTRASQTPSFPTVGSFPEVKNNSSFGGSQTNGPPVFTSFNQIGAATNLGSGARTTTPGVPTNSIFGQPTLPAFGQPTQPAFGQPTQPAFGQPTQPAFGQATQPTFGQSTRPTFGQSTTSTPSFAAPTFGNAGMKFGVQDASGSQMSRQTFGSMSSNSNFPNYTSSSNNRDIDRQSQELLSGMAARTSAVDQAPVEDKKNENQDDSIWLKEKWTIGQIRLDEPPQRHVSHVF